MGGSGCGLTTLARARGDARRLLGITLGEDGMLPLLPLHVRAYDSDCLFFRIVKFRAFGRMATMGVSSAQ